jgi:hypothetical protein
VCYCNSQRAVAIRGTYTTSFMYPHKLKLREHGSNGIGCTGSIHLPGKTAFRPAQTFVWICGDVFCLLKNDGTVILIL